MSQTNRMTYFMATLAFIVAISLTAAMVHSQDFGFPEETGLSKDKQNAQVSQ